MELQVAPLGYTPTINLGGYVPAAAYRPTLMQQALASFISGAAGSVASKGTDALLTKDYSTQAANEGLTEAPQGLAGRMLTPMSAEQYARLKSGADEKAYRDSMVMAENKRLGLEGQRVGIEKQRTEDMRKSESDRMALELQKMLQGETQFNREMDYRKGEAATKHGETSRGLDIQEREVAGREPLTRAQARHYNAEAGKSESLNRMTQDAFLQNQIKQLSSGQPDAKATMIQKAAASLAAEGKTLDAFPSNAEWQAAVMQRAQDLAKADPTAAQPPTDNSTSFLGRFFGAGAE